MSTFSQLSDHSSEQAAASSNQLHPSFNLSTPQQLRDQVIWQGIRRILWLLDQSAEAREILRAQDEIFRIAQAADQ